MSKKVDGLDEGEDITLDRLIGILEEKTKKEEDPETKQNDLDFDAMLARHIQGNYFRGHSGRPGLVGGSLPRGAGGARLTEAGAKSLMDRIAEAGTGGGGWFLLSDRFRQARRLRRHVVRVSKTK